jgi:hypothetical protein
MKEIEKKNHNKENENKKIKNKFLKRYEKNVKNGIINYIEDFIDRLKNILGDKIKVNNKIINITHTHWIIDHDYLGNSLKTPIIISKADNIIEKELNNQLLNKDVYFYRDKSNKVTVYYDIVTLQYLGYSSNNKELKKTKNVVALKCDLSIRDCLFVLGLENEYSNIYHLDSEWETNKDLNLILHNMLRNRIINLKHIVLKFESIIYSIFNSSQNKRFYNEKEKIIINEFTKKLKKFNLKDKDNHNAVFKDSLKIINQLNMKKINNFNIKITNNSYIDSLILNKIKNIDSKLLFYLIFNLNRLLDYNKQPIIESELAHLIVKIIKYSVSLYYYDYSDIEIRKFDYMMLNEAPIVNANVRFVGLYSELLNSEEIDDQKIKDDNYDAQEEFDALDIDDYEIDDDIDGTAEALDGYE